MNLSKTHIAICIATFKRNEMLNALLESLKQITLPEDTEVSVRIIDNDFQSSARPVVTNFSNHQARFTSVCYRVQPERNIALTRNAAIEIAEADMIVFVDDDETVEMDWLEELVKTANTTSADAVFGSVKGNIIEGKHKWLQNSGQFDKCVPTTGTEITWKATRTSNTLVFGKWFYSDAYKLRFNPVFGRSGGSDTELFERMENHGAKFVSAAESIVHEDVPANRCTLKWLIRRYYRNGLIYERIIVKRNGSTSLLNGILRFAKRVSAAVLGVTQSLVVSNRSKALLNGLLKLPLAMGGLVYHLTPKNARKFDAYAPRSERALKRVAFLTNIISPYRKPVFENLAKTSGWNFRVFVDAKNEFDRQWKVDCKVLKVTKNFTISIRRKVISKSPIPFSQVITLHIPVGLIVHLIKFRPAVVVSHELGIRTFFAAMYTTLFRRELIIWAYQSKVSSQQGGWREGYRRFLLRRANRVVGMGKQARSVLLSWGVPSYKIVDAPNAADHRTLEHSLRNAVASETITNIRNHVGQGKKIALVAGRLVPLKGISHLLETWARLPEPISNQWVLVFVGEGPLKQMIHQKDLRGVVAAGHVSSEEIAYWYAAADLHIFASNGDVWGLAVNEASACGTPTLCSVHAGCFDDLIHPGNNGLSIDFSNPDKSLDDLKTALHRNDLPKLGLRAQKNIKQYTIERLAMSFRTAVGSF